MANHAIVACGPRVQMQRNSSRRGAGTNAILSRRVIDAIALYATYTQVDPTASVAFIANVITASSNQNSNVSDGWVWKEAA